LVYEVTKRRHNKAPVTDLGFRDGVARPGWSGKARIGGRAGFLEKGAACPLLNSKERQGRTLSSRSSSSSLKGFLYSSYSTWHSIAPSWFIKHSMTCESETRNKSSISKAMQYRQDIVTRMRIRRVKLKKLQYRCTTTVHPVYNCSKKICENLLPVGLLVRTNLLIPSRFWTTYTNFDTCRSATCGKII